MKLPQSFAQRRFTGRASESRFTQGSSHLLSQQGRSKFEKAGFPERQSRSLSHSLPSANCARFYSSCSWTSTWANERTSSPSAIWSCSHFAALFCFFRPELLWWTFSFLLLLTPALGAILVSTRPCGTRGSPPTAVSSPIQGSCRDSRDRLGETTWYPPRCFYLRDPRPKKDVNHP